MSKSGILKSAATTAISLALLMSCGAGKKTSVEEDNDDAASREQTATLFSADSAYSYVARQVEFGPRVPGTDAHRLCGEWLADKLNSFGADVIEQKASLTAFDGTVIPMRNIFARINPNAQDRVLLLAHWDSRPWADHDPDETKRSIPVDGANDGASGVGVLLELARILSADNNAPGVDILLCDAEDWGEESNDESWALGARYFAENLPVKGYAPSAAILLDMVGAPDATFMREYFSQLANPALADEIWAIAHRLGYGNLFINRMGSAVNDDHVELIKAGIPAIDIIDYREGSGFYSGWHTTSDNMDAISKETLGAVGNILEIYLLKNQLQTINE
ncbi:MAG: M28 family peptidase [Muribaculaceae bacterium]|nr:M28 family peptidase [Muribaculaceae bacterium]